MTQTAKRKLSEISFEHEGAHVALVSKEQQPANGHNYALVLKASKFSKETLEKMQSIKVTLSIPEFLEKFFNIYGTNAEVLARMLGYVPPEVEQEEYDDDWYENYVQSKLQSFEIIKSAYEAENVATVLSELDETQYLALLKDQQNLERAFKKLDKAAKEEAKVAKSSSKPESKTTVVTVVEDTSPDVEAKETKVSPSVVTKNKETNMTVESTIVDKEVEVVEKSAFVAIEKQLEDQKVALQKAMDTITAYENEKKQAIAKAKTDKVNALVKDEKHALAIAKAGLALESEDDFTAFMQAVQAMTAAVETSEMFVEKGASVEVTAEVSPLERILKAKFQSK